MLNIAQSKDQYLTAHSKIRKWEASKLCAQGKRE